VAAGRINRSQIFDQYINVSDEIETGSLPCFTVCPVTTAHLLQMSRPTEHS